MLKSSLFMLCALSALNACVKKNDASPGLGNNHTIRNILMSHSWVASDVLLNDTSIWMTVQDCEKDNIFTFRDNNEMNADEGPAKCNPSDPQSANEVWKLLDNDHRMIFYEDTVEILEASSRFRILRTDGTDKYEVRFVAKP